MLTAQQFRNLQAAHAARIDAMLAVDHTAFMAAHRDINRLEATAYRRARTRHDYTTAMRQLDLAAQHPAALETTA